MVMMILIMFIKILVISLIGKKNKIKLQLLGSCVIIPSKKYTKSEHNKKFSKFFEDIKYVFTSQGGQAFDIPLSDIELKTIFTKKPLADEDKITPCQMLWNRYHLTAEGYLTACCVDYNLNLVLEVYPIRI